MSRFHLRAIAALLLVLALPFTARLAGGETAAPAPANRVEAWYRLLLNGQPAGFTREIREEAADGLLSTEAFQRLVVRRGDQPVEMEVSQRIEEKQSGEIVKVRMVQRMAENDVVSEGVVKGDRLELTVSGAGNARRSSSLPYDPRAVGPRKLDRLLREKLLRAGDSVTAVTFFPEKNGCGNVTVTRGAEETVEFPAGSRRLARRTSRADVLPGIDLNEWVDGSAEVWKTSTNLLGMSIETYRSTAEEILRSKYASPPEIFYTCSVRPDRPLKNAENAREILYRFSLRSGDFSSRGIAGMFRGTGQTVTREESPASRVVRIGRVGPERSVELPVAAPLGLEEFLAANSFIQSDDPLIQKLAREAVGGERDAFEASRKIERWVKDNVRFKDLRTPFASAREVAEKRVGDCTEHGLLLAALARAAGIPSRVVSGLVYAEGTFLGHLWTEVYLDRWIPLDGTRGRGEVGPDHIALTASALTNSSAADLFFDLAQVIGNLRIEVLEEK